MKDLSSILELPAPERLELVEAIWDSLVEVPEAIPLSDELRHELDLRLESYYQDPTAARPWSEIRDELFGKK